MLRTRSVHGTSSGGRSICWPDSGSLGLIEAAVPIAVVSRLKAATVTTAAVRSTANQLKAARFPQLSRPCRLRLRQQRGQRGAHTPASSLPSFLEDAHNVVLIGGPRHTARHISPPRSASRPSSTIASASGPSPPSQLVNALEQEKLQGKPGQIGRTAHPLRLVVILDELGYLPSQRLWRGLALPSAEQAL